jgi:flagellar protein FliS
MSSTSNPSQEYLKNAVMTAPPEQLQLMLYDGAIRFTTQGLEAMRVKDREGCFNALDRAQRIVLELSNGLRHEINPELAEQMSALYSFVYRQLVEANVNQEPKAAEDALRILRHLRETWVLLLDKLTKERKAQATDEPAANPQPGPQQPASKPAPQPQYQAADPKSGFHAEG